MSSLDAKNVAQEVLETIGSGEKVILGEIIRNNGYADTTSLTPKLVTETKSYKDVVNPVVKRWEKERERLTTELESRILTEERYETVMKAIDIITKNIQLLSGKETEIISVNKEVEAITDEAIADYLANVKTTPTDTTG